MDKKISKKDFLNSLKEVKTEKMFLFTEKNIKLLEFLSFLVGNREVLSEKVRSCALRMASGQFMPPVIIALPSYQTPDGNHRIAAALLNAQSNQPFTLRVIFVEEPHPLNLARVINNNQKAWKPTEYLNSFCTESNNNYLLLRNWLSDRPQFRDGKFYQIKAAMQLIKGGFTKGAETAFKEGFLELTNEELNEIEPIYRELCDISRILGDNKCFKRDAVLGWRAAREVIKPPFHKYIALLEERKNNWLCCEDTKKAWSSAYMGILID